MWLVLIGKGVGVLRLRSVISINRGRGRDRGRIVIYGCTCPSLAKVVVPSGPGFRGLKIYVNKPFTNNAQNNVIHKLYENALKTFHKEYWVIAVCGAKMVISSCSI